MSAPSVPKKGVYFHAAPMVDISHEQFNLLLGHASSDKEINLCATCRTLGWNRALMTSFEIRDEHA